MHRLFLLSVVSSSALAQDVGVLAASPNPAALGDVMASLGTSGQLDTVTGLDLANGTPSALMLGAFDSVFVFSEGPLPDPVGLGDALADYVDAGGGVVLAGDLFAAATALQGRFVDEGYAPVTFDGVVLRNVEPLRMRLVQPSHASLTNTVRLYGGPRSQHVSDIQVVHSGQLLAECGCPGMPGTCRSSPATRPGTRRRCRWRS
jgi:hypothetical protein